MLPIFEITSLKHAYTAKTVLDIDHLTVQPASIVGLIGPNGSGKSTLLRLLGLIEKPSQGKILFNGQTVEPFSDAARFQITILPQEPFLLKRSVFNNVSYGLNLRRDAAGVSDRVAKALSLVGLAGDDFMRRPWYALSGGEAQRVALAARLVLNPRVLLMDEPTANVDAASAQLIKEAALKARKEWGTTLVVASHDWHWLYEVCDEILHVFKGKIFGTGRETLMFGPWVPLAAGKWGKRLSDRQLLWVPRPPHNDAAAVIDTFVIAENNFPIANNGEVLQGTVSQLSLERKTGLIWATIMVGDLPFAIGLTPQQTQSRTIFPGKAVYIHYRPDKVKWI